MVSFKDAFYEWKVYLTKTAAPLTSLYYSRYLAGLLPMLGALPLEEVEKKQIENYLQNLSLSARRIFIYGWNSFSRFVLSRYGIKLFSLRPQKYKTGKSVSVISEREFSLLSRLIFSLDDVEEPNRKNVSFKLFFCLTAFGCLKPGEVLKVRPENLRKEGDSVVVLVRGSSPREVKIEEREAAKYLWKYRDCLPPDVSTTALETRLRRFYLKVSGKGFISPQTLRNTCICRKLKKGDATAEIMAVAGLKDRKNVERIKRACRERN